jgi:signal transduction histidine kinase
MTPLARLLRDRKEEIIRCWRDKVHGMLAPGSLPAGQIINSLPSYLDELVVAVDAAMVTQGKPSETSRKAREHGEQRLMSGFDVHQVIHEYGILHEVILDLVEESAAPIAIAELRVLAHLLMAGTSEAVGEYARQRDAQLAREAAEHVAFLAHELRSPLQAARTAAELLGAKGADSAKALATLSRNLDRLSRRIDESIVEVRLTSPVVPRADRIEVAELCHDVADEIATEAALRGQRVSVEVPAGLELQAERRLVRSAIANLARNAVKFSRTGGDITLRARASAGRVFIEVEDSCGGVNAETRARMFKPFVQLGKDRSGFGLGLAICKQVAEAHEGTVEVHNLAGKGCVLVLDVPAQPARQA